MANNNGNNNSQNTKPSFRSDNIGNKQNQVSELDLIHVNTDQVKKELGTVFDYINNNINNINKTVNDDIYKNTKKASSSIKGIFNDLFNSLNKYSNNLDKTIEKLNSLSSTEELGNTTTNASSSGGSYSGTTFNNAVFNNSVFNSAVFNDVVINERGGGSTKEEKRGTSTSNTSYRQYKKQNTRFDDIEDFLGKLNRGAKGNLNEVYDYQMGDNLVGNFIKSKLNKKRANLRDTQEKYSNITGGRFTGAMSIASDVKGIGETVLKFAKPYWEKGKNAFEQNYTKVAGLASPEAAGNGGFMGINTGTDMFNDMLDSTVNRFGSAAFSYSEEMIPSMVQAMEKGFQGNNAILKAQEDMVASKVLPWMDTQSEGWINMSFNMDKTSLDQIKNQQLILKETESGNRILQEGVANQLTNDFAPMLTNMDTNLGIMSAKETMGEYYDIMQGWINNGATAQQAYAQAQDMMQAQKNPFEAITSGNVNQILLGSQFAQGAGPEQAFSNATMPLLNQESMAVASGDVLGAGAMNRAYGTSAYLEGGWIQTVGKANVLGAGNTDKLNSGSTDKIKDAVNNIANYNTEEQKLQNQIENKVTDMTQFAKNFPITSILSIAGTTKEILSYVVSIAMTSAISTATGVVGGRGGGFGGIGSVGTLGRFAQGIRAGGEVAKDASLATRIGAGLGRGGITAGGASTATAITAGLAGLATGGYMGYQDAKSAIENRKKWGVDSSAAAGIGGFFGGGEGSAANAGMNALKWGAIGAGIGSFIPGVGTLAGGLIGAAAGGLMGLAGGDEFSKMNQQIGDEFTSHAKGVTFIPKDGYKASLHKGEMVVNAKTASKLRDKGITGKSKDSERDKNVLSKDSLWDSKNADLSTVETSLDTLVNIVKEINQNVAMPEIFGTKITIPHKDDIDTDLTSKA